MMRRKNLERAVILGLLLSTSVYGNAWAEGPITENSEINSPYTGDVTFQGDANTSAIEVMDRNVAVSTTNKGNITLNSEKFGIEVTGTSNINLNSDNDNIIFVQKPEVTGANDSDRSGVWAENTATGSIILDAKGSNKIEVIGEKTNGIFIREGSKINLNFIAQNGNVINVESLHGKGIVVGAGSTSNLTFKAVNGNNTLVANGSVIYNAGSGIITIESSNGNNIITSSNQSVANYAICALKSGEVNLNGNSNIITVNSSDGVALEAADDAKIMLNATTGDNQINSNFDTIIAADNSNIELSANQGNNFIDAANRGVYAKGKVTITANKDNNITAEKNSAIQTGDNSGTVILTSITGKNILSAGSVGVNYNTKGNIISAYGNNEIIGGNLEKKIGSGLNTGNGGSLNVTSTMGNNIIKGGYIGLNAKNSSIVNIIASNGQNSISGLGAYAILAESASNVNLTANKGINSIDSDSIGIYSAGEKTIVDLTAKGNSITGSTAIWGLNYGQVTLEANEINNEITTTGDAVFATTASKINLIANKGINDINSGKKTGVYSYGEKTVVALTAKGNSVSAGTGIKGLNNGQITLTANALNNEISTTGYGIYADSASNVELAAMQGNNIISSTNRGIFAKSNSNVNLNSIEGNNSVVATDDYGIFANTANVNLKAGLNNNVSGETFGIAATASATKLDADVSNIVSSNDVSVYGYTNADIDLIADENNALYAGEILTDQETQLQYGKAYAVKALSGSTVTLDAGNANDVYGAVYANGTGTDAEGNEVSTNVILDSANNVVKSYASIANAGGLKDTTVISALYAEAGAQINVSGENNTIMTYYSKPEDDTTSERVIWAYDGADIAVDGKTTISTAMYDESPNNMDIAIAAGTATGLDKDDFTDEVLADLDIATVTLNYENNGESKSSITGDILSAYGGVVDIKAKESLSKAVSDSGINIYGNLLAGNTGVLNVDIGKGSILTGRADDYGDANVEGTTHGAGKDNGGFFNPAFSSEIITGGEVNLTMGEESTWNVTGQSWITELNTKGTINDTYIDLVNAKTDLNTNASALTIGTLNGDTTFHMNLDGNRSASDMLYIKNADGKYQIDLAKAVTNDEINKDGFDGLRFATVGTGSNVEFTVGSYDDGGAFNVEYTVDTDSYEGNSENTAYNSTTDGSANVEKPGNDSVDNFFGLTNTATEETPEVATNSIMLMAENEEAADNAANADSGLDEVTNFKIVARADEELNDTGETILNMSRANYSNAIYMDRLNKRFGEARYINDDPAEDEGMWVRIRHDRIGKDDAYRSQNTMYELGYDKKQDCDNGERRVGFAVDYMHGDTGYTDIAGKGEIDRYGLWLYDTWMGDKGHYVDYVAKWGHLDNDFEVYTMRNGDKVTGDYSNNVFSVSAEYGRKKDIGSDWYFEPQAQLQLARVTGADYTTNQGTKVSVDGINSLIGRAGFRIGKDFGEEKQSTLYFKADVLHEFLGDQDVYVMDKSTDNKWAGISYDNEGTWYDIGIGYAAMMSKSSYAFIDLEQSFGNDNDDTYQINAGVRWTF